MGFEDGAVFLLFEGEEGVGVVGVELEGLADVRVAHGAWRERWALGF